MKLLFVLLFGLILSCAPKSKVEDSKDGNGSTDPGNSPVSTLGWIEHSGSKVAYFTGFISGDADVALLYIPSADRYSYVNLSSGVYPTPTLVFSGLNCSGTIAVHGYLTGPLGKIVFNYNGSYYKVNGPGGSFTHQSYYSPYNNSCQNGTPSAAVYYPTEAASIPYNFSAIAPLTIKYQ